MITRNNTVISKQERICTSLFSLARGLILRKKQNLIMIFPRERQVSLHMVGVLYSIDILILDKNKKIVEIKRNLKPFTFWTSHQKGQYVIELAFPGKYKVGELLALSS